MQDWQAGPARWCAGFVVQPSKRGQRSIIYAYDAITVASYVPLVLVFDATRQPMAIVLITGIDGTGDEHIGDVVESNF
jgi:hypothetical protein